jgi:hypothetical protein
MIRAALALSIGVAAAQAQAGQDVPPPRAIRPIQPMLAAAARMPAYAPSAPMWRDTPPVMQGWSRDRHVPVVGLDRMSACEARALVGMAAADDRWLDDDADYAADYADVDFDDGGFSSWGDM